MKHSTLPFRCSVADRLRETVGDRSKCRLETPRGIAAAVVSVDPLDPDPELAEVALGPAPMCGGSAGVLGQRNQAWSAGALARVGSHQPGCEVLGEVTTSGPPQAIEVTLDGERVRRTFVASRVDGVGPRA